MRWIEDQSCSIFSALASSSTSAGGCNDIVRLDLVKYNMVDAIVATGASIVDMDFFESLVLSTTKVHSLKMMLPTRETTWIEFMTLILMRRVTGL